MKFVIIGEKSELIIPESLNIYSLVDPVYPADVEIDQYFKVSRNYLRFTSFEMNPIEYCIALAHVKALEEVIRSDIPCVILEQDVVEVVGKIDSNVWKKIIDHEFTFLHLGIHPKYNYIKKFSLVASNSLLGHSIFHIPSDSIVSGAFAYYVTPATARMLLESQSCFLRKADDWQAISEDAKVSFFYLPLVQHPKNRGVADQFRSEFKQLTLMELIMLVKLRVVRKIIISFAVVRHRIGFIFKTMRG